MGICDIKRDSEDLGKIINEDTLVQTRYGDNPKKSWPYLEREIEEKINNINGLFVTPYEVPAFNGNQFTLPNIAYSLFVTVNGRSLAPSDVNLAVDGVTVTLGVDVSESDTVVARTATVDSSNNTVFKTPAEFGATGDGVVDDTLAVQLALDSGYAIAIDKVYAVTSISIPKSCYMTCIGSGKIKSISAVNTRVCQILSENVGRVVVDGNLRAVNAIHFPEGLGYSQTYESLHYENIQMEAAANTSITGVSMAGDEVVGGAITGKNLINNGYINGSFPQGLVTGGGNYIIQSHYLKDGVAGFVPTGLKAGEIANNASGKVWIGTNHTVNCEDNSAYLLGGDVIIGHNIAEGIEESVQINFCKSVNIGRITAVGRTLGAFNIQNAQCNIDIGEVVGRVPVDTDPEDYGSNCPTAIGYFRSGNVTIGSKRLSIGRVSGYFQLGFLFASAGHLDYFSVQGVDADIMYNVDEPTNPWQSPSTNWLDLSDVNEVYMRNPVFRIHNVGATPIQTFTSNNNFAWSVNPTGKGVIQGVEIYLIDNDGEETDNNHVRGSTSYEELSILDGYWRVIAGTTYWVNPRYANYLKNSTNAKPTGGCWLNMFELTNRNFEYKVDDIESYRKDGSNSTQNWFENTAKASQVSSQIPGSPIGTSIIPDVRGQIYLDLQSDDAYYGYALQAGKWLKITT